MKYLKCIDNDNNFWNITIGKIYISDSAINGCYMLYNDDNYHKPYEKNYL